MVDMKILKSFVQGRQDAPNYQVPPEVDGPERRKAARRVAKMSTHELLNWADAATMGVDKGFQDYRKEGDPVSLEEIRIGLIGLEAITLELLLRDEAEGGNGN